MPGRLLKWFESRASAATALKAFLDEPIPASTGWRNTLGSVVGAILLVQIVTGVLLALYYVPHPEAAFESIVWLERNITLGAFVRALHYWGASFAIVAAAVHLLRVLLAGAYRPPRELNWLTGLVLFGIVITLAFTGQLLPYNQMGYWAATVGIEIASSAPVIGESIRLLMTGGDTVGALTLTRFYALHVVVLPALLGLIVVWHLALLRKHGPMRRAGDNSAATEAFFPRQFFRDMVAISIGLFGLVFFAVVLGGPESPRLDLSDASYTPRPEWYFLAHFELLKLTQGELQRVLVAFVLPSIAVLVLALLPWLDRGTSASWRHRKPIVAAAIAFAAAGAGLTVYGWTTVPKPHAEVADAADGTAADESMAAADPAAQQIELGRRVFREQQCFKCHVIGTTGADIGPDLTIVGLRIQESFLRAWLADPKAFKPQTIMPPLKTTPEKFEAVVQFLLSLNTVPDPAPVSDEAQ